MKKKIVSILCASVLTLSMLAGCGGSDANEKTTNDVAEEQTAEDTSG